jgi:hypothetical protein
MHEKCLLVGEKKIVPSTVIGSSLFGQQGSIFYANTMCQGNVSYQGNGTEINYSGSDPLAQTQGRF